MGHDLNPFEPPRSGPGGERPRWLGAAEHLGLNGVQVKIWLSYISGLEIYWVDGREVQRHRSFRSSAVRQIPFPDGTHLEFRIKAFPFVRAEAWFDGQRIATGLFPNYGVLSFMVSFVFTVLLLLGIGFAVALGLYFMGPPRAREIRPPTMERVHDDGRLRNNLDQ